jgi:predicted RNA binding protein YcfA (HicA-like mRNA interferase family)
MATGGKVREMINLLEDNGFVWVRGEGKGSHRKYHNPKTGKATVVPFHNMNHDIGLGLWKKILRDAGL